MFSLENINKYINEFDGNKSTIMHLLEYRIIDYCNDQRSGFHKDEYFMLYEFCLFDDDYFRIKRDILENHLTNDIADIGCQFGFQSEIFKDTNKYTGIECSHNYFFNENEPNINYIVDTFPDCNIDLKDKIVISNMSLGYFNCFLGEKWNKDNDLLTEIDLMLIGKLSESKILYCNSRPLFINGLKNKFNNYKYLGDKSTHALGVCTGVYKFW